MSGGIYLANKWIKTKKKGREGKDGKEGKEE